MRWLLKIVAFKVLSFVPKREFLYSFIQRKITHSILPTKENILQKFQVGIQYLEFLNQMNEWHRIQEMVHIDLGAGWMPTIPMFFYSVGVDRQVLCDMRRNMNAQVVSTVVRIFREIVEEKSMVGEIQFQRIPPLVEYGESLDHYFSRLGIQYAATYEARDLLKESGPKLVTCTQVLLYLSVEQIVFLFRMVASALAEGGGVFIATVHLYDLYSDFDHSISGYNKWRYSDFVWEKVINSKLMSFNRLTASDYRRLLEENGFKTIEFRITGPTASDLKEVARLRIHKKFQHIPTSELVAKHLFFAATLRG